MLKKILDEKHCFKLILGAANQDLNEIEELSYIYSLAGANFIDFAADVNAMKAVKKGVMRSEKRGISLCASVATDEDIHISKAIINSNCVKCNLCESVCPQEAIANFQVIKEKCVGCRKCFDVCKNNAIDFDYLKQDYETILPPLIEMGLDSVEFHIGTCDFDKIYEKWKLLNQISKNLDIISVSISRKQFQDNDIVELLKELLKDRKPYSTIIQADGKSISGGDDTFVSTSATVEFAKFLREQNFPVYINLAGGTNSKSSEFAKISNVDINGVGIGSYARKVIRNLQLEQMKIEAAKNLVQETFRFLK